MQKTKEVVVLGFAYQSEKTGREKGFVYDSKGICEGLYAMRVWGQATCGGEMERSKEMIKLGCAFSNPRNIGGSGRGSILDPSGICQTVITMSGG